MDVFDKEHYADLRDTDSRFDMLKLLFGLFVDSWKIQELNRRKKRVFLNNQVTQFEIIFASQRDENLLTARRFKKRFMNYFIWIIVLFIILFIILCYYLYYQYEYVYAISLCLAYFLVF